MSTLDVINKIVVFVGIPSIITGCIFIGAKLNILGTLDKDVREVIKPDLKDIRERFFSLEGKMSGTYQSNSPISLTSKGSGFLVESGLKGYIDTNKDMLINLCEPKKHTSSYEVQSHVFEIFDTLTLESSLDKKLKEFAFQQGVSTDILRRLGAIYFRDMCLKEFDMAVDDIDNHS